MNQPTSILKILCVFAVLALGACANNSVQTVAPTDPEAAYDQAVYAALEKNTTLPRGMWALGLSGVVHVEVILAPSGEIISADVTKSSGTGGLDDYALQQIQNTHFPAVPANLPQIAHTFEFPINYPVHDATY